MTHTFETKFIIFPFYIQIRGFIHYNYVKIPKNTITSNNCL